MTETGQFGEDELIGEGEGGVADAGMSKSPAKSIGLMQKFANVSEEESPVGSLVPPPFRMKR